MTVDHKQFVSFLSELPAEGETLLLGKQAFERDAKGALQYHADGAPKAKFPAFTPAAAKIREGDSWYVNTASFLEERMTEKTSAKRENAEYVLFMMLDDIGTKSKVPPIEPTWIMETSEGSFQWGYVFDEQPTKGEFAAAIRAIADAGYTDPGAVNAVRWCRIPGSINAKKGRNEFAARIVEWHPDRGFDLDQICKALDVVPGPPEVELQSIRLEDTGNDKVLAWLSDNGMVLSAPNHEGWAGIVCPNVDEHTDGNPEARYSPQNRAFLCYHGHCQGVGSTAFLEWVKANGGPDVQTGLRDDLVAERLKKAQERIEPNDLYSNVAQEIVDEVEKREMGRVARQGWFDRFAYIESDDGYFDVETRREIGRSVFDATYRGVDCRSKHNQKKAIRASHYFDERRDDNGAKSLAAVTYAPGETVFVHTDGLLYGNTWVDARPDVSDLVGKVRDAQVKPWLDLVLKLIPDAEQREHCLDVMAHKILFPRIKINHAVLHGGDEGCGKDTMWAPMIWAISGPGHRNRQIVDGEGLKGDFHYDLEGEVVVLNELREPEAAARRALANKLKPIIAAPPEMLRINRKNKDPYKMLNRIWLLAFTNFAVPISLESTDRRWMCVWSTAGRMSKADAKKLWDWYNDGGFRLVTAWLRQRDVSEFSAHAAPPMTDWKESMIENGRSGAETYLVDLIRERTGPFSGGCAGAPFHKLIQMLHDTDLVPSKVNLSHQALLHAFKEAGWKDLGRIASADHPNKKQCFAADDVIASRTKSEIRRMVEPTSVGAKLKAVA